MAIYKGEVDFYGAVEGILPHQKAFLQLPNRNAALVGGQGNGKSIALCLAALLNATQDPNGFSLIGRLNYPALINSTMKTFLELVPQQWGEWKPSEKRFIFANGHELVFFHLDISDPKVAGPIKSMNLSGAYIDEASEISEDIYYLIDGRVRRKNAPRHLVRLTSNPAGHDWLWRNFFDPNRKPALHDNVGITASTFDNVHLPQGVVNHWLSTYPEDWAARYLYGSFSDFSDLVYKEFTEASHVWDATREHAFFHGSKPPLDWPVIVGIDIGSDIDPWAIPLIACSPDGRLFQFDEVYGSSLLIGRIAEELHFKLEGRPTPDMAFDYANRQAALELAECGIHGQPAIKEVRPGLFKTAQYMHVDPRLAHPFDPKQVGSARYFVSSACPNTIRELSAYKWAKDRGGTVTGEPSHENSHSPDAVRYAIHTFRPLPEKDIVLAKWENKELDEMSRLYWYEAEKHQRAGEGANAKRYQLPRYSRFRRPAAIQWAGRRM